MDCVNRRALIFALALLAGLAAACAGEQRADNPQPTISREDRADRPSRLPAEAPPSEQAQEQEQAAALEQDAEPEEAVETQADQAAAQSDQTEPTVAAAGTIQSGWRAGVRADRNVLGDPDAEIVITEWSDYQ